MRLSSFSLGLAFALACAEPDPDLAEPNPLVELGGGCAATIECGKGLHCSAGQCAKPVNEVEKKSVEAASLERKIADTIRHEKKAFTEDGKRRMRAERAKLRQKLAALEAN